MTDKITKIKRSISTVGDFREQQDCFIASNPDILKKEKLNENGNDRR